MDPMHKSIQIESEQIFIPDIDSIILGSSSQDSNKLPSSWNKLLVPGVTHSSSVLDLKMPSRGQKWTPVQPWGP